MTDKILLSLIAVALVFTVISYGIVFHEQIMYDFYHDQCEEWLEKKTLMPSGKVLIPGTRHTCKKWKENH